MRTRFPLILALLVYLLLAFGLAVRVPLGAAPDEPAHWEYTQYLAERRQLPVFAGQAPPNPGYEFHQPALYYILSAPFWAAAAGVSPAMQQFGCRAVNIVLGMLTLVLIWRTCRILFPERYDLPSLAVGFAALWPMHQTVGTASGNDALAGLICSGIFYWVARGTVAKWDRASIVGLGLTVAAGIYTKNTCLVVALAAFLALASSRSGGIMKMAVAGGLALVVSAPLLIRNTILYGDPFGIKMFAQAATAGTPGYPLFSQMLGVSVVEYWRGIFLVTTVNTWGVFGGPDSASRIIAPFSVRGPRLPTDWYLGPLFIMLAASALSVLGLMRVWGRHRDAPVENDAKLMPVWIWWIIGVVLVFLAWLQFSYGHFSGAQARYLHPALLPVCIGVAAGWTGFWGKGRNRTIATAVVGVTLLVLSLANHFVWRTMV